MPSITPDQLPAPCGGFPAAGRSGIRFVLTDGDGGTSTNSDVTVSVTGVNDAPTLTATGGNSNLSAVATPGKVICLGLNYLEHVKEGSQRDNIPKFPTIFMRGNSSLVPHGEPIIRPKVSETLDYEAELIFIVGKRAKHLTLAQHRNSDDGARLGEASHDRVLELFICLHVRDMDRSALGERQSHHATAFTARDSCTQHRVSGEIARRYPAAACCLSMAGQP